MPFRSSTLSSGLRAAALIHAGSVSVVDLPSSCRADGGVASLLLWMDKARKMGAKLGLVLESRDLALSPTLLLFLPYLFIYLFKLYAQCGA